MAISGRMDVHMVVSLHNATRHWKLKEKSCCYKYNMDRCHRHYAELKKPDMEECILYGSVYVKSGTMDNQSTMTEVRRVDTGVPGGSVH